ncbi:MULTISPECIES: DUF6877 family protein [unclassified Sporosarcina]|uniref:DUF6877 family protein n=1 Tax=unclassified Sporosarcina TaxID=2647733 RepID=UPI001A92A674|nr:MULTISPECIES: DUF6877 family protein [unclassified Sporosarcina]MBO0587605.1 hypothetical protein [Sporosarcina sp. E16_8]MBO0602406.1 hypothetical protein [Sporosarcina sp. E16_3]
MNPINEITKVADRIPLEALRDKNACITDWLAGGGNHDDPYVWQHFRYAQRFVKEGNE